MTDYKALSHSYLCNLPKAKKEAGFSEAVLFVMGRFQAMAQAKASRILPVWVGGQRLRYCNDWEWIIKGEGFERPVRGTTLRDIEKSLVDKFMQDPPDVKMKAKNDSQKNLVIGKKAYIESIRESVYEKKVRRQCVEDMFGVYGCGFRRVKYFEMSDGKCEMGSYRLPPEHVFPDETALELQDKFGNNSCRDIIIKNIMPISTYELMCEKRGWVKTAVHAEAWETTEASDMSVADNSASLEKSTVFGVKVYEYMNVEQDLYIVIADNQCVCEGTMTEAEGINEIPIAMYQFETRNDSFWPNTLPQILAAHIYLKDTLFNLELQNLKLTIQPVIAMSGSFGFNKKLHQIQAGAVWQAGGVLNGNIGDHVQPIAFGNPNTQVYNMMQVVSGELSQASRSDIRTLEFVKNKTATEAQLQNQSMNAHNETIENINEIEAEAILVQLMLKLMKALMNDKDGKETKRNVNIKGYQVYKTDSEEPYFEEQSGIESVFELSQEMIDVEAEVTVEDRRSVVAKNSEKVGRIMQILPIMSNIAAVNPEVAEGLKVLGIFEQFLEYIGLDVSRSMNLKNSGHEDPYKVLKADLLFGHKIDVPEDETRDESLARYMYFSKWMTQLTKDKKLTKDVELAVMYHLNSAMKNIQSRHYDRAKLLEEAQAQEQQQAMIAQQGMQNPQAMPTIPQADKGLISGYSGNTPSI